MTGSLAILGTGGHAKVIADTAAEIGWSSIFFFDDRKIEGAVFGRWPFSGSASLLAQNVKDFDGVVVGIGSNRVRQGVCSTLIAAGGNLITLIHPHAYVSRDARVCAGTVVFAGAVIQAGARIGHGVIVNTGATVDHDCVLADYVHVSPGVNLAGGVSVGECAWVGIGSAVRQNVVIGPDAVVGAGSAVVGDVSAGATVAGVPARLLSRRG